MVDASDVGVDAVVGVGAGADVLEGRGVDEAGLEAEEGGLFGRGDEVEDGRRRWDGAAKAALVAGVATLTVTSVTPSWESTGQASAANWAMSHWGVAWGLPMRPVGRWTVTLRASSQPQGGWSGSPGGWRLSKVKATSGWAPAWVVEGRVVKPIDRDARHAAAARRSVPITTATIPTALRACLTRRIGVLGRRPRSRRCALRLSELPSSLKCSVAALAESIDCLLARCDRARALSVVEWGYCAARCVAEPGHVVDDRDFRSGATRESSCA